MGHSRWTRLPWLPSFSFAPFRSLELSEASAPLYVFASIHKRSVLSTSPTWSDFLAAAAAALTIRVPSPVPIRGLSLYTYRTLRGCSVPSMLYCRNTPTDGAHQKSDLLLHPSDREYNALYQYPISKKGKGRGWC